MRASAVCLAVLALTACARATWTKDGMTDQEYYEEKVDGWRMLAYKQGDRVRLISRNGRDHTRRFRDLTTAIAKLSARTLVLDGEIAIYDQQFRSRLEWLRRSARGDRHDEGAAYHRIRITAAIDECVDPAAHRFARALAVFRMLNCCIGAI